MPRILKAGASVAGLPDVVSLLRINPLSLPSFPSGAMKSWEPRTHRELAHVLSSLDSLRFLG